MGWMPITFLFFICFSVSPYCSIHVLPIPFLIFFFPSAFEFGWEVWGSTVSLPQCTAKKRHPVAKVGGDQHDLQSWRGRVLCVADGTSTEYMYTGYSVPRKAAGQYVRNPTASLSTRTLLFTTVGWFNPSVGLDLTRVQLLCHER